MSESMRLAALDRFEILDTPAEPLFDSLTDLAAQTFSVPIALISLVDSERQWFKSRVGLDVDHTHRDISFCQHAILSDDVLVVEDAARDARFCDNPLVVGAPNIRFYAGAPLITREGFRLGTLCIIDTVPRAFAQSEALRLQAIARSVMQAAVMRLDSLERERISIEVDQKAELLRQAEDMAGVGTWSWDVATDRTIWSPQVYRIHGYDPADEPPPLQGVLEKYHPDDAKLLEQHVYRALSEGADYGLEARIYRPDGTVRHVVARGSCRRDTAGAVTGLMGTFQDVTEHVVSERFIRSLTDNLPGMVGYWDHTLHCRFANAAYGDWFGQSAESMLGMTLQDLLGPELFACTEDRIKGVLKGQRQSFARTQVRPNGDVGHIWADYIPDIDASGRTQGFYVLATDITDLQQAQDSLAATNQLLVEARDVAEAGSRTKSAFLANMSHELRTPLTSVIGFSGLLSASQNLPDKELGYVEKIATASVALLSVINDILDYSKLEADAVELDLQAFDPGAMVKGALEIVEADCLAKGLELDLEIEPGVPVALLGDEGRLRQVALNFLSNAVKFTRHGRISLKMGWKDRRLNIAVNDSGIGVAADKIDALFERFVQADTSTTRIYGGTGLGLSISRRLIDLMGGLIGVESRPGEGSTFWLEVPLQEASPDAVSGPTVGVDITAQTRILLADDVAANRDLVGAILSGLDVVLDTVEDGAAAVEAAKTGVYDLILMDVHMPVMDGLEATRAIRSMEGALSQTPILALTANVQPDQVEACRDAGMSGHVGKPIRVDDLIAAIAGQLEGASKAA